MNVDGEHVGPVLGSIRIEPPKPSHPAQPQFTLTFADTPATADLPKEYKMQVDSRSNNTVLAFSNNSGRMASEGVVQHRLDVEPGAGGISMDPAYRKISRERHQKASAKTRKIQMMTDPQITNIRRPVGALKDVGAKRKSDTKRTAMDREELQAMLFRKFEKQAQWSFVQLNRETDQPTGHLKSVLGEIAIQLKRGPYKDLWELKSEFKTNG